MRKTSVALVFALLFPLFALGTSAYDSDGLPVPGEEQTRFSATLTPQTLHPGEHFRVDVKVELEVGWHLYSVFPAPEEDAPPPTKVKFSDSPFAFEGPLYETQPLVEYDKVIQLTLATHQDKAHFYRNFTVPADLSPQQGNLDLVVSYQICSFRVCLNPAKTTLSLPYEITSGPVRPDYNYAVRSVAVIEPPAKAEGSSNLGKQGFWAFIGLAALMGLAGLIMPCVFPMIPITISYFSKQAEGNPTGVVKLASLFGLGIVVTYTGTGLLLSSIFGAGSAQMVATNPWVNLGIAGLFIVFAISLMGAFTIGLPAGIQTFFDQKARNASGAVGVILMGFTFTLTAFTCTVQFVGTLMIAAAQGEWIWPLIGMLVFSAVFAFPFFLLALMPSLIGKMRNSSGLWLGRAKVVLGILEMMASLKFISNADLVLGTNLLSRDRALVIWIICLVIAALYLGVTHVIDNRKALLPWSWVGLFGLLAFLAYGGLGGKSLTPLIDSVLPPAQGSSLAGAEYVSEAETSQLVWHPNYDLALAEAKKTGKPIFLEFTGYTCVNCRWMEQNIMPIKSVHAVLSNKYTLARLYTDGGDFQKPNMDLQINRFKTVALPLYILLSPEGEERARYIGIVSNPNQFEAFLARGLNRATKEK